MSTAGAVALTADGGLWSAGTTVGGFDGQAALGLEDLWISRWTVSVPIKIVEGPAIEGLTESTVGIAWTTDQACDSEVRFSRSAWTWEGTVTDATPAFDHRVTLTQLHPDTTYRYQVRSAGAGGNAVTSDGGTFRTFPSQTPPAVSHLTLRGGGWPSRIGCDVRPGVDRVEIEVKGVHQATLYGPPFEWAIPPSAVGTNALLFLDVLQVAAGAAGRPLGLRTARAGLQVIMVELVAAAAGDLQLLGHRGERHALGAQLGQQVADERSPVSMDQLTRSLCIRPAWGLCPQTPKVFRLGSGLMSLPCRRNKTPRDQRASRRSRRETQPWLTVPLRLRFRRAVSGRPTRHPNIKGLVRCKGGAEPIRSFDVPRLGNFDVPV
ncbi:MAG: fibronectin type III domain-containing protein [Verrucomicrobia bacterium]|nr:fibronectin type III domain-containing protein [Verrucomicrobiota bacterium]